MMIHEFFTTEGPSRVVWAATAVGLSEACLIIALAWALWKNRCLDRARRSLAQENQRLRYRVFAYQKWKAGIESLLRTMRR